MKKNRKIELIRRKAENFYPKENLRKIRNIKRITIYECAYDEDENVVLIFNLFHDERKIIFYDYSMFRKDVSEKIKCLKYPLRNLRKSMYSNFRYLKKMAEVKYETSDLFY